MPLHYTTEEIRLSSSKLYNFTLSILGKFTTTFFQKTIDKIDYMLYIGIIKGRKKPPDIERIYYYD